jgi:glycosyltransferase involved in cell wall biosynthesis
MKITFVLAQANLSGGVRIVAEHARMLHERGHEVTVASSVRRRPGAVDRLKAWVQRRPLAQQPETSHLEGAPYRVVTTDRPRPVMADDLPDADLILATWWETAEWVAKMPASKGVKVNFLQHYEAHPGQPKERVDAVWRLPMRKIVVSTWLQEVAATRFGDRSAILVPNGLDVDHFRFVERGPSGRRVIGAMFSGMKKGSFKRFWLAAKCVETLRRRGVGCEFIGFGARAPRPDERLPEPSRFEIAPDQCRIPEIYSSCDCWLFTSETEGYGLPLLEAMACGTPVVATPAGAAPELLASGGGTLVDSSDPEEIANAVETLLGLDEAAWRAMSRAARAEAERHSWGVIGDRMEGALEQILAESGERPAPPARKKRLDTTTEGAVL